MENRERDSIASSWLVIPRKKIKKQVFKWYNREKPITTPPPNNCKNPPTKTNIYMLRVLFFQHWTKKLKSNKRSVCAEQSYKST